MQEEEERRRCRQNPEESLNGSRKREEREEAEVRGAWERSTEERGGKDELLLGAARNDKHTQRRRLDSRPHKSRRSCQNIKKVGSKPQASSAYWSHTGALPTDAPPIPPSTFSLIDSDERDGGAETDARGGRERGRDPRPSEKRFSLKQVQRFVLLPAALRATRKGEVGGGATAAAPAGSVWVQGSD